jgi:hypothetical protein
LAHHHEDSKVEPFAKSDIGFREMTYVMLFGITAAGAVMFSFLYFSSLEDFAAPPFMVSLLVGIFTCLILAAGNMIVRWLFSLDD